jgi:hypothetical protein
MVSAAPSSADGRVPGVLPSWCDQRAIEPVAQLVTDRDRLSCALFSSPPTIDRASCGHDQLRLPLLDQH